MPLSVSSSKPKVGVRNTRQRTAVVDLLSELDNFASAKEIHRELEERDARVGLTTVYRTLQSLAEIDAVDVLHMASGESLYRACHTDDHHHHLVCTECGRTEEIDGGPVEKWAKDVAKSHGFRLTGHDAEIFGVCQDCAAHQARAEAQAKNRGAAAK
ncbi:transcriptional repressor [Corynebacterium yudongzhengii]|uniref:Transcriptional repressor n=1 Tax=Corynebacterium yudongzhengii TaxID=2080740 RepID=A0A2U1T7I4_9CORY|nr:Fur family transcriptional regulator [Corynebacterium yudongzhengii]AWB81471.1 transcriptional repressor [Corynebacterium yudongzhengii]PWC01957.1 transcriptional repressor [Corynebacterium yudongzhengii]